MSAELIVGRRFLTALNSRLVLDDHGDAREAHVNHPRHWVPQHPARSS